MGFVRNYARFFDVKEKKMTYHLMQTLPPFFRNNFYGYPGKVHQPQKKIDLVCQTVLRQVFKEIRITIPGNPYQRFYRLGFKWPKISSFHPFLNLPSFKQSAALAQNCRKNLLFEYRKKAIDLLKLLPIEKELYAQIMDRFYDQGITLERFVQELTRLLVFLENDEDYLQRENASWNGQPHPAPRLLFLIKALEQNDWPVIPALIQSGLDPNLLLEDPYEESYFDRIFIPLLHFALKNNHVLASAALIQAGADVNQESVYEKTSISSLEIAAKNQNPELLQLLIQQGVDLRKFGRKALDILLTKEKQLYFLNGPNRNLPSLEGLTLIRKCQSILTNALDKS